MHSDLHHDPTDTHAQALARSQMHECSQQAQEQAIADLRWLMRHRQGRRVVWRWLDAAGVWRLSFNTDAVLMAFNEGGRNQGLRLLQALLAACPAFYHVMMQENQDERNTRDERHERSDTNDTD